MVSQEEPQVWRAGQECAGGQGSGLARCGPDPKPSRSQALSGMSVALSVQLRDPRICDLFADCSAR